MKIKVKILLKSNENKICSCVNALKIKDTIIYNEGNSVIKVSKNSIIKEDKDSLLTIDFINCICTYLLKENNVKTYLNLVVKKLDISDFLKIEYEIEDNKIIYEITEE